MMAITPEERAAWQQLAERATPGPWRVGRALVLYAPACREAHQRYDATVWTHRLGVTPLEGHRAGSPECVFVFHGWEAEYVSEVCVSHDPSGLRVGDALLHEDVLMVCGQWGYEEGGARRPSDAHFIAAARTALPQLLEALASAEAEVARLRAILAGGEP